MGVCRQYFSDKLYGLGVLESPIVWQVPENTILSKPLFAGTQRTPLLGVPFSRKHPPRPKCKLAPSKEGLVTSKLQLFHSGGWNSLGRVLYRKGAPLKRGALRLSPNCTHEMIIFEQFRGFRLRLSGVFQIRGFEKGLAGGGWRPTAPKTQQKMYPRIVFSYS